MTLLVTVKKQKQEVKRTKTGTPYQRNFSPSRSRSDQKGANEKWRAAFLIKHLEKETKHMMNKLTVYVVGIFSMTKRKML